MWTEIIRRKYQREGQRYASDLTDAEWALIEPHMPPALMFAFKGPDANIRFRGSGRGSAHRCARPETGPEDAG